MNKNKPLRARLPLLTALIATSFAPLAAAGESPSRLLELSIEELSELQVTSASRRPEPLAGVAAAIFVITADDIRRSSATSIPELLRLVPGLHVAQLGSRRWAISARGFNGEFANKLLVQIDGRSVYTPVHSGVNWDVQDTLLADIERIEVIRGPGATQWGANAVNGVINIITKSSEDTQGGLVSSIVGNRLGLTAARWGDTLGESGSYRAYGKYFKRDEAVTAGGDGAEDAWWQGRIGFRSDWEPAADDSFTLQGDLYQSELSQVFPAVSSSPAQPSAPARMESRARGGNLLGRWTRARSADNEISVQSYVDWTEANPLIAHEHVFTVDLDLQHRFRLGTSEFIWGLGYRRIRDSFDNTFTIAFEPSSRTTEVFSGFVEDTISLSESLSVSLGSKIEHNDYTGIEIQPSVRLAWAPNAQHTVWAAASRAARTPSRAENDLRAQVVQAPGVVTAIRGNRELDAEQLTAYELGYRLAPSPRLFLDFTVFHHEYQDLIGTAVVVPDVGASYLNFVNSGSADSHGLEMAARWQVQPSWRLDLAYSYLDIQRHRQSGDADGINPQHQFSLSSRFDLTRELQLDGWLRHVSHQPGSSASAVPSYTELNLRLGWQPQPGLTLSLAGQNLLHEQHQEIYPGVEIERSVYLRLDQRF